MKNRLTLIARKALGFALVLSAMAGTAFANIGTPEIDAGTAASAMTLLAGGMMLLRDKFRAR